MVEVNGKNASKRRTIPFRFGVIESMEELEYAHSDVIYVKGNALRIKVESRKEMGKLIFSVTPDLPGTRRAREQERERAGERESRREREQERERESRREREQERERESRRERESSGKRRQDLNTLQLSLSLSLCSSTGPQHSAALCHLKTLNTTLYQ
jgi:hypothetical protein